MTGVSPEHAGIVIQEGPREGALQAIVAMHAAYYAKAWGFGSFFETKVANELAEFLSRYDRTHDRMFLAVSGGRIVGSLIVDGGEPAVAAATAHLRWFIVDESHHGRGAGKALMREAMAFIQSAFSRCYLTTFAGLDPARALYGRAGFRLVNEVRSETWGTAVAEQHFEWVF